ncbi:MAG: hypothetical protein AAF573_05080 [Bacteroidota bacterium]
MATDVNIWANHQLKISSVAEGMSTFEKATSQKIRHWNFHKDKPPKKTTDPSTVVYFTNFEMLERNFTEYNYILLKTNFKFCEEIMMLGNVLKILPTQFKTRYSKWLAMVAGKLTSPHEAELKRIAEWRKHWLQFRKYTHALVQDLGGNKIIYLDDHSYQQEEDLFYKGESLENVITLLQKTVEGCELELYELFPDDRKAKFTWHFDNLGK